jgi:sugar phosphate isomerase/epimerase
MLLGYNTNGFAHHRLEDAIAVLADLGYRSVAITLDHNALNPGDADLPHQVSQVRRLLEQKQLHCVIETGARFLLDAYRKHQPTLLSEAQHDRDRRLAFLQNAVDIAHQLGADAVSFWSGAPERPGSFSFLLDRLVEGCRRLCDHAQNKAVLLAFEPEPGMLIDTMEAFGKLHERVAHPLLGLTIDIGHLQCQGEVPIVNHLVQWQKILWNIHLEDMRRGVHEHLMFGEGEIDFPPILRTLKEIAYSGGVHVELSRHSHNAVETARRAFTFLATLEGDFRSADSSPA